LSAATRALEAQSFGLDVTGQNIANVNTPGYTRRSAILAEIPPEDSFSAGGGVTVTGLSAARAPLLDARLLQEQPLASRDAAVSSSLQTVQTALGQPGASIDNALSQFYDAFAALSRDPTSSNARYSVVTQGQALSQSFNQMSTRIADAGRDADSGVRSSVQQINSLAGQIASINTALSGADSATAASLGDQLGVALQSLSKLVDISTITHQDGSVDVSVGNGRALVVGANTYQVQVSSTAPQGYAALSIGDATITSEITGGQVGGLLHVRDVLVPTYATRLDQLAYGVATSVNSAHAAGFDLAGNAGGAFFTPLASSAGAAASISMNAAVVADPSLVAAAGSPSPGDNANAQAISNLRTATISGGNANPLDSWSALVYRVGADAQSAQQEQASHNNIVQQIGNLRDQVSGVSLDEEATMMVKFQRAYQANARFFSAIDQSFDTVLKMVGA